MHSDKPPLAPPADNAWSPARRFTRFTGIGYGIFLVLLSGMSRLFGESWWGLSPFLYLPFHVWLLPLVPLVPAAWFYTRRTLSFLAACVFWFVLFFAGFRFGLGSREAEPGSACVTVLTNNIGQSHRQSMAEFVKETDPDVIVLQDAAGRGPWYRRVRPDRSVVASGEFVVISRFPISRSWLPQMPKWRLPPVAAFQIEWPGRPFTLYAVHLPTPRHDLYGLRGRGFLAEAFRGGSAHRISQYAEAMRARVEVARSLSEAIAAEKGPVLVAGDFNAPSWGYVHSLFAAPLTDAFSATGRGFGFTFPGDTVNPLTGFGPWLRLDCLFCNNGWQPLWCKVELARRSQHRAVAARFEWHGDHH